jgi:hypothetical protein
MLRKVARTGTTTVMAIAQRIAACRTVSTKEIQKHNSITQRLECHSYTLEVGSSNLSGITFIAS